jgi:dUTPase
LVLANSEGVIDVDYQQEVFVLMTNISKISQTIAYQERIAQGEVVVNEGVRLTVLNEMPTQYSERDGGFGSTGTV